MKRRIAMLATAVLMAAAVPQPVAAQIDWRDYLGDLYTLSYAINACDIKVSPVDRRRLERLIARGEAEIPMRHADLVEFRRRTEADARRDQQRTCATMRRAAPRMMLELPGELED